jgi:MFS family permease
MHKRLQGMRTELVMYFILISAAAIANGLSDSVYSNYFKEVYKVTAFQRGLIEFPRELPGLLCALVIGLFGFIGDLRLALIAQVLAFAGVTALGLFTPPFAVMLIFLFINSMGMHLFMPLQDAIGMSLAEPHQIGRRMGQYSSVRSAFGLIAALLVFFGFRSGFFSFQTEIKWIFIVSAAFFLFAVWTAFAMAGKGVR